ncbi:MAG: hypothetical protein HC825_04720 [Oscillatoriales cyanobacterium RM1_1_9]|nr:hypothetical protein [Oscillatoriales cyanobacterium RM1_1_9]
MIKNQSGIPLEYSLTTGEIEVRPLANQGTAELTNLPQEVFLLIDPIPSAREITLRYEIQVTDQNMVNVTVKPSPDPTGVHTINIQPDGAIYVY